MINHDYVSADERLATKSWHQSEIAKTEKDIEMSEEDIIKKQEYILSKRRAIQALKKEKIKDFFKRVFKFN